MKDLSRTLFALSRFKDILNPTIVSNSNIQSCSYYFPIEPVKISENSIMSKIKFKCKQFTFRKYDDVMQLDRYIAGELKDHALHIVTHDSDISKIIKSATEEFIENNPKCLPSALDGIQVFSSESTGGILNSNEYLIIFNGCNDACNSRSVYNTETGEYIFGILPDVIVTDPYINSHIVLVFVTDE